MYKYLVFIFVIICDASNVPPNLRKCNINDNSLGRCITEQVPNFRPHLREGINNMPSLSSIHTPEVIIDAGPNQTLKLNDVNIYNVENFQMMSLLTDAETGFSKYKFYFEQIDMYGIIKEDQIFIFPISKGPVQIRIRELEIDYSFYYTAIEKNGTMYMDITNEVGIYRSGYFSIHKKTSPNGRMDCERINRFLIENSGTSEPRLMPLITELIILIIKHYINKLHKSIPASVLYNFN